MKKKRKKKKTVINKQKFFCFISFMFILICILWYGGRGIYFYLDSRKNVKNKENLLVNTITNNSKDNIKKINGNYYFYNDAKNNYLTYSNLTWRIIKVTKDKEIVLILENPITTLAYGKGKTYKTSYITTWLNNKNTESSGILENNLNNKEKYLMKTKTCIDKISNIKNITCKKTNSDNYLSLLSIVDYINTGAEKSFINTNVYTYLINKKNENKIWYITDEGKLDTSDGEDIYGIKPTITIKPTTILKNGDGTENNPYIIEEEKRLFASYVKLDNDIWQVYDEEETNIKLVLNNYVKLYNKPLEHIYSNNDYIHNDTIRGSMAYYLNKNYLNNLTYQKSILTNYYINYYYGEDTEFDYTKIWNKKIDTKVYMPTIGDIIFNNNLENYFIATGTSEDGTDIYIFNKDYTLSTIDATEEAYTRPCITISKNNLKLGSGTSEDPYRME